MDTPFLSGQLVRVVRVRHELLAAEIGAMEIVSRCVGRIVWCRPTFRLSEGDIKTHNFEVARHADDLEAVTCD